MHVEHLPEKRQNLSRFAFIFRLCCALLVAVLFFAVAKHSAGSVDCKNADFIAYWLAGKMIIAGENPYSPDQWLAAVKSIGSAWTLNSSFVYPLTTAMLFAPLGLLSPSEAYFLWILLTQSFLLASMALLIFPAGNVRYLCLLPSALAGLILFRPTLLILQNGQISGLLLLVICGVVYLWEKGRYRLGGVFLSLLTCKPNIGVPVIMILSLWLLCKRRQATVVACLSGVAGLTALAMLYNPYWLGEFIQSSRLLLSGFLKQTPTLPGYAAQLVGRGGIMPILLGWSAGTVIAAACGVFLRRRHCDIDSRSAINLAIVFTLLLTPYAWPYDQLLLIVPLVTVMLSMQRRGYSFLLYASLPLAVDLLAIILFALSGTIRTENYSVLLTLLLLSLLVWQVRQPGRDNLPILPSREGVPR